MDVVKVLFVVLLTHGIYSSAQVIDALLPVKEVFKGFHSENGSVQCRSVPATVGFSVINWYYSDVGQFIGAEWVYEYDDLTSPGNAYGRLAGRATHSHENGVLTLNIHNTSITTDNGTYFCEVRGSSPMHNNTFYSVSSNANGTIEEDMPKKSTSGSNVIFRVTAGCNYPAVRFILGNSNNYKDSQKDEYQTDCPNSFIQTTTVYEVYSVTRNFSVLLEILHPTFDDDKTTQIHHVTVENSNIFNITTRSSDTTEIGLVTTPNATKDCPKNCISCKNALTCITCVTDFHVGDGRCFADGCVSKTVRIVITVVAALVLLSDTVGIILIACVFEATEEQETSCENQREQKNERNQLNMEEHQASGTRSSEGTKEVVQLKQVCMETCPCCRCCLERSSCCKDCLRNCLCCKYCLETCSCCASCICIVENCKWCLTRLFGITCGSFVAVVDIIVLIFINIGPLC